MNWTMHNKTGLVAGVSAAGAIIASLAIAAPAMARTGAQSERKIDIVLSAGVRHDSNVARASSATAAARGVEQEDQRFTPAAAFEIVMPVSAHSFSVTGNVGYDFYRRNDQLNRERADVDATASLALAICDTDITAGYARRQSDLGEIGAVAIPGVDSVKNVETTWNTGATVSCGHEIGLRPTLSVGYERATNDNNLRRPVNYNRLTYSGGLGYRHPLIGDILLFVSQSETRFPNQALIGGGDNGYDLRNYGVRFSRDIGARMKGSFELSFADVNPRLAAVGTSNGLNWNADLVAEISPRLQVHGAVSRAIVTTLSTDAIYHRDSSYALDATFAVNQKIDLKGGFVITPRRFFGSSALFGSNLTRDQQEVYFATLAYDMTPRVRFLLEGARESRNANGTFFDYRNTRVGLRAEFRL